jgi:hypothetical protein
VPIHVAVTDGILFFIYLNWHVWLYSHFPGSVYSRAFVHPYHFINVCKACEISASKVQVTFTLEQATKAQRGSGGIALLFLLPWR